MVEAVGHSRATKANAYLSTYSTQLSIGKPEPTPVQAMETLAIEGGNRSASARRLGIARAKLYRLLGMSERGGLTVEEP